MSEGKADELEKPNTPVGGASDPNARVTMKGCNQTGRGVILSPRDLWEALLMKHQQWNMPLGLRSVFDLLPVDHHDQQHDEAQKSES